MVWIMDSPVRGNKAALTQFRFRKDKKRGYKLKYCFFPLSDYTKEEVKKIARDLRLGVSSKPESQNFIAGGYFSLFKGIAKPGPIFDKYGNILGRHKGVPLYTIGQHRGLGISAGKLGIKLKVSF